MTDLLREILESLGRSKLRTTLTGLSVSVGIFLLILLQGAGNGIIHAFEAMSGNLALDVVHFGSGWTSKPHDGLKEGRQIRFKDEDMQMISLRFPRQIAEQTPELTVRGGATLSHGTKETSAELVGVSPAFLHTDRRNVVEGRFINETDMKQRRKIIVINQRLRNLLFAEHEQAVGTYLRTDGVAYQLVGVFSDQSMSSNKEAYLPFSTAQALYNKGKDIGSLRLRTEGVKTEEQRKQLERELRIASSKLHRFAPDDERAVWIYNSTDGAEAQSEAMDILRTTLWVLGLLTLLSGVVSVSNIMLVTVKERTHEFGIRKALGAKPWSILRSVMLESVLITAFFGYIGIVAGIAGTEYLNYRSGQEVLEVAGQKMTVFLNPTVDMGIALQALLVLVVAGVLAGFVPARRAVSVKPIEALRSE